MTSLISYIKHNVETNQFLRELKYGILQPLQYLNTPQSALKESEEDIRLVLECPDYSRIPRVENAGQIENGKLIMHNGLKVLPGSYYGYGVRKLLQSTGGVHEPQEELAFSQILKEMPEKATMLELGAYWSFYSLWFYKSVNSPKCFLVEPILSNLNYGKKNFSINNCLGDFTNAYVGGYSGLVNESKQICVDDFLPEKEINHLNILHSDIQGYEVEMLHGAEKSLSARIIDYIFISTHSNQLHDECINLLESKDYLILASANLDDSFARDGVIVARRREIKGIDSINISLRSKIKI